MLLQTLTHTDKHTHIHSGSANFISFNFNTIKYLQRVLCRRCCCCYSNGASCSCSLELCSSAALQRCCSLICCYLFIYLFAHFCCLLFAVSFFSYSWYSLLLGAKFINIYYPVDQLFGMQCAWNGKNRMQMWIPLPIRMRMSMPMRMHLILIRFK